MKGTRYILLLCVFVLLSSGLSGCTANAKSDSQANRPLRIEWTQWWGDYTMVIAREKGFFEKHGVEVEPVYYEVFSQAVPDLAAGKLDGGLLGISDLLAANSNTPMRAVIVYDDGGVDSVVADSGITRVEDLRGKIIGTSVGYAREIVIREMLADAGMTIRDVQLVAADPETVSEQIPDEISAGQTWEPYTSKSLAMGQNLIYSTADTGSLFPDMIVFRESVIQRRPEDIQAFVDAWFEAVEYRLSNPEEANKIISDALGFEVAQGTGDPVLYTHPDNLLLISESPGALQRTIYEILDLNIEFLKSIGGLTFAVDPHEILDSTFIERVGE